MKLTENVRIKSVRRIVIGSLIFLALIEVFGQMLDVSWLALPNMVCS